MTAGKNNRTVLSSLLMIVASANQCTFQGSKEFQLHRAHPDQRQLYSSINVSVPFAWALQESQNFIAEVRQKSWQQFEVLCAQYSILFPDWTPYNCSQDLFTQFTNFVNIVCTGRLPDYTPGDDGLCDLFPTAGSRQHRDHNWVHLHASLLNEIILPSRFNYWYSILLYLRVACVLRLAYCK
jgi:hypothetical protein